MIIRKIKDVICKRKNIIYKVSWTIFFFYLCLMIWEVFIGPYRSHSGIRRYNLYPFKTIIDYFVNEKQYSFQIIFINLIANVVTFVPLGFFIPLLFNRFNKPKSFLLLLVLFITGIETMQYTLNVGVFDVDDIILNLFGCMLGFLLLKKVKVFLEKCREIDA